MGGQNSLTFWYVLASDGGSEHRDMCLTSAHALRHVDPAAKIGLLCDPRSAAAARDHHIRLEDVFDEVLVHDTGGPTPMRRSRELKLSLRNLTAGDICYLDSDTLLVQPIRSIPDEVTAVGMAYDGWWHVRGAIDAPPWLADVFLKIGWSFPPPRYFNGGVIFWRDNEKARGFARAWLAHWADSVRAGVLIDQPALGHTDRELGGIVDVLPPRYNAQVGVWPRAARGAVIWHFWYEMYRSKDVPLSLLDSLLQTFSRTGQFDTARFDRARAKQYPWVRSRGFQSFVYTGNYLDAAMELPSALVRLLRERR